MKKGITCALSLLFFWVFSGCSSNQTMVGKNHEPGWHLEHFSNGKTQFEVNIDGDRFFYGIRLKGLKTENHLIPLQAPKINDENGLLIKTWSPHVKEHWYVTDNINHVVIEIDHQWLQSLNTDRFQLLYEVDSNHQASFSGNFAPVLSFYDPNLSSSDLPAIRPVIHTYWSNCPNVRNINLRQNGPIAMEVRINDSDKNLYLTGLIDPGIRGSSSKTQFFSTVDHDDDGRTQSVYHQELRKDGQLQDRIKVVEERLNEAPKQSYITDWPNAKTCEFTAVNFGASVAIKNDWLGVSATNDCQLEKFSGAVYLFHKQKEHWRFHSKLKPNVVTRGQSFGMEVGFHGDRLYVLDFDSNLYVFRLVDNHWVEDQVINNGPNVIIDAYSVEGNKMVLAVQNNSQGNYAESTFELMVFGFDGAQWLQTHTLKPELSQAIGISWQAVIIDDQHLAATASVMDEAGDHETHEIHVFQQRDGLWEPDQVIMPPDEQILYDNDRTGFGSNLLFHAGDLYASDRGFHYQSEAMEKLPNECVFADQSGVYHQYVQVNDQWSWIKALKFNNQLDLIKHISFNE